MGAVWCPGAATPAPSLLRSSLQARLEAAILASSVHLPVTATAPPADPAAVAAAGNGCDLDRSADVGGVAAASQPAAPAPATAAARRELLEASARPVALAGQGRPRA